MGYGFEHLRAFRQALALEPSLGKLASVFVAGAVVDHSAPAGILPGGRADVNTLHRQRGSLPCQLLPGVVHEALFKPLASGMQLGWGNHTSSTNPNASLK
jgi:hypothetical protein